MFKSANVLMKPILASAVVATTIFLSGTEVNAQSAQATPAVSKPKPYMNMGRNATPAEVAAWDIDVRPDFKGLPVGSGSVAKGRHFGKNNAQVVTVPLVNLMRCSHRLLEEPQKMMSKLAV